MRPDPFRLLGAILLVSFTGAAWADPPGKGKGPVKEAREAPDKGGGDRELREVKEILLRLVTVLEKREAAARQEKPQLPPADKSGKSKMPEADAKTEKPKKQPPANPYSASHVKTGGERGSIGQIVAGLVESGLRGPALAKAVDAMLAERNAAPGKPPAAVPAAFQGRPLPPGLAKKFGNAGKPGAAERPTKEKGKRDAKGG